MITFFFFFVALASWLLSRKKTRVYTPNWFSFFRWTDGRGGTEEKEFNLMCFLPFFRCLCAYIRSPKGGAKNSNVGLEEKEKSRTYKLYRRLRCRDTLSRAWNTAVKHTLRYTSFSDEPAVSWSFGGPHQPARTKRRYPTRPDICSQSKPAIHRV